LPDSWVFWHDLAMITVPRSFRLALGLCGLLSVGIARAQLGTGGFSEKGKRDLSGGSTAGASLVPREPVAAQIITLTAVSPERVWISGDGLSVTARLLAFSAPAKPEDGPTEVIREGKIRFLRPGDKAPIEFELARLSEDDQIYVKKIAEAAAKVPVPAEGATAEESKQ